MALRRYGRNLGMAFQIVDDLLDFTGDASRSASPRPATCGEGKVTLAVIDLLVDAARAAGASSPRASSRGARPMPPEIAELSGLLRESGAIERAQARARDYAARARVGACDLPRRPAGARSATVPELLSSATADRAPGTRPELRPGAARPHEAHGVGCCVLVSTTGQFWASDRPMGGIVPRHLPDSRKGWTPC